MNTAGMRVASIALATPQLMIQQEEAAEFILSNYSNRLKKKSVEIARKVFGHPSIKQRSFAFNDPSCLIDEKPDSKIERFTRYSVELSAEAANKALKEAGLKPEELSAVVVNTCTGYICPGISTYLIEKLGLRQDIKAYDLVGSGCGRAIPNLQLCGAILKEDNDGIILSISTEICSSTFQMGNDLSLIVSNALFADGAAAMVFWNRPKGLAVKGSASYFEPRYRENIRFIHQDGQLHNHLSKNLPQIAAPIIRQAIDNLLKKHGLGRDNISGWALHPGGENVINALKTELGLSEERLEPTRYVLKNFGNLSSPTVWFVMKNIVEKGLRKGEWYLAAAFGAGFSVHTCLFQAE
ncbi:MAG: type III polyketide synthase [Elusimicrobia bacterium]|nr:type III polyketide synthase [Candidatus Liberimonas magnetica]